MPTYEYIPQKPRTAPAALLRLAQDAEQGDGAEVQKANILGDLLNVLSRPARASAQAVYNATDDSASTSFVGGALQGLAGKGQVSYKDVLTDNFGVENKWVASIGGFLGDVALDPLTYVGVKPTKGVGKTEALLKAVQSGADDVAEETSRILATNPTRVGLTVAGKPLGPKVNIPAPVRRMTEKLLGPTEDRKLLAKAFQRDAELPLGLNNLERVAETSNAAMFDNFRRQMRSLYTGLTPDEQRRIALALDKGESLAETVMDPSKTKFTNLQDYVTASRKILDDWFVEEGQMGMFTLKKGAKGTSALDFEEYNPEYVYRYFRKPPKDLELGTEVVETKVGGVNKGDFTMKRKKNVSIEEAEKLGYEPLNTIQDIMDMRAFKHYRSAGRASFVRDGIDQFAITGQDLKKLSKQGLKSIEWVPVDKIQSPVAQLGAHSGKYVPDFIARAMNMSEQTFRVGSTGNEMLRLYDKALGHWKFLNTAPMPGFHIRNTMSDIIMNAADGVWNPERYRQAAKVMGDRKLIADRQLGQLLDPDATSTALEGLRTAKNAGIKIGGKTRTTQEVWELYGKTGAKSGLITSEFQRSLTDFQKKGLLDRASKGKALVGDMADAREDWIRLAHFIDATDTIMKKSKNKMSLEDAAFKAAERVRKYNIDYGNLSTFERNVMKRIVPFYCVPEDHEILTKRGWLNYHQLLEEDLIMVLDPQTHEMRWEPLQGVAEFDYDGELWGLQSKSGDHSIWFTPNHRWPVTSTDPRYRIRRSMKQAKDINSSDHIPTQGEFYAYPWEGSVLSPRLAAILGWIVTDGYFRHRGDCVEAIVYQHPKKYLAEIENLLGNETRSYHPETGVGCVSVLRQDIDAIFGEYFQTKADLPSLVTLLDREAAEAMWQAMFKAEGSSHPKAGCFFAQNPGPVLEAFQTLTYMTGRSGWISSRGMTVRKTKHIRPYNTMTGRRHYTGKVWCPNTPTGTWFVRFNGMVMPTGNTWMRKATPLNVELLFTKPGFMALYPKGQDLMQGLLGTDDGTGEMLIPEWIRESAPVRVAMAQQANRSLPQDIIAKLTGAGENEAVFLRTEGLAPMATLQYPGNLLKQIGQGDIMGAGKAFVDPVAGQFTPFIKAPVELVTGRSMFNGQELPGAKDWLASQTSLLNTANRVVSGKGNTNLLSSLTGAQFAVANASRQEGEFRRRQDAQTQRTKTEKEELLRKRVPNYDELSEAQKEAMRSRLKMPTNSTELAQRRYLTQILGQ